MSEILTVEHLKNLSLDEIIQLYRQGYILGQGYNSIKDLNYSSHNLDKYILDKYITEKISIIIPVHHTEEIVKINNTIEGIRQTIGKEDYTITMVGTLPKDFDIQKFDLMPNSKYIKTDLMLGDSKNLAAYDAIVNYKPDILIFMDAHMNFFADTSKDWGNIIASYLSDHPQHIVAPAISLYDKPYQRGFGVYCEVEDTDQVYDLKWKWQGNPTSNNEPFEVAGLCGCLMAMSPFTFMDTMGYTPALAIDDREFNIRAWTLGKTFVCIPKLTVGHRFTSGYSDFSKTRSIQWGFGHLLTAFLNMDDTALEKLYSKGIGATADKSEALRMTTSNYWKNMRLILKTRRVRTADEYFVHFKTEKPRMLSLG